MVKIKSLKSQHLYRRIWRGRFGSVMEPSSYKLTITSYFLVYSMFISLCAHAAIWDLLPELSPYCTGKVSISNKGVTVGLCWAFMLLLTLPLTRQLNRSRHYTRCKDSKTSKGLMQQSQNAVRRRRNKNRSSIMRCDRLIFVYFRRTR